MRDHVDAVVVGAGVAGLACALQLARRSRRVLLVDSADEPARAGASWVNGVERTLFAGLGLGRPPEGVIVDEPPAFTMQSPGGHRVRCAPVPTVGVDMRALQAWLLDRARSAGADVRHGVRVEGPALEGTRATGVNVTGAEGARTIGARLVVDAAGLAAPVRDRLPGHLFREPFCDEAARGPWVADADLCLAHQEVRSIADPTAARRWLVEMGLLEGETLSHAGVSGGYSICNVHVDLSRGTAGFLSGSKLDAPRSARRLILDLVERLGFIGERVFGGGRKLPLRRAFDLLVGDGWALLGDAGSQMFPSHGSGVATGMLAATLLADVADRALTQGELSRAALWPYAVRWHRRRGAVCAANDVLRRLTETLSPEDVDTLVRDGLLGEAELAQSLACAPAALDPASLALRAPQLLRRLPWLLRRFLPGVVRATQVQGHYERFPERWDAAALAAWSRRTSELFDPERMRMAA